MCGLPSTMCQPHTIDKPQHTRPEKVIVLLSICPSDPIFFCCFLCLWCVMCVVVLLLLLLLLLLLCLVCACTVCFHH